MEKTPRRGRPPKPAAEKRSEQIVLALTPQERRLLDRAARETPPAVWAREAILRAARRA